MKLFRRNLAKTNDVRAAATLTLADTLRSEPDRSLTVTEAAAFLNVSRGTVFDLVAAGKLRHHRISAAGKRGRILFCRADLEAFRERSTVSPLTNRISEHMR